VISPSVRKLFFAFICVIASALSLTGAVSRQSHTLLNGARSAATLPVAVAGDSEDELRAGIALAIAARKQALYVTVRAARKQYLFSPYAQIVRTATALIVRAYGRVYVFSADNIRNVTYNGYASQLRFDVFPLVNAPWVERSIAHYQRLRASGSARTQFQSGNIAKKLQICPDCAALLLDARKSRNLASSWSRLKDPWQIDPDYTFWRAAAPTPDYPQPTPRGDPGSGGDDGSSTPDGEETPPPTPPPFASSTEVPDSPDGPGHGPRPSSFALNTGSEDAACPRGYFLAFEEGSGTYGGGVYCAVDFTTTAPLIGQLFTFSVDNVYFADQHFWNRHLACHLHNTYTRTSFEQKVLLPDFESKPKPTQIDIGISYYVQTHEDSGALSTVEYHAAYRGSTVIGIVTYNDYNVGTAFFTPRRPNCPRPYPNYP